MDAKCSICNKISDISNFYKIGNSYTVHKECQKQRRKIYYEQNKEKEIKRVAIYNKTEKGQKYLKDFRKSDKNKQLQKDYRNSPNGKINIKKGRRKYIKNRMNIDPCFRLKHYIRSRLNSAIKSKKFKKKNSYKGYLGCSIEELKQHLEKQFKSGMTWENHGEWHIDHIIPLSSAQTEEEIYKLNHYTNLQPLWAKENMSKGSKIL